MGHLFRISKDKEAQSALFHLFLLFITLQTINLNHHCHTLRMNKKWNKKIQGNKHLRNAFDPLRNYLNCDLPNVSIEKYTQRPPEILNLSEGDPTTSKEFRTHHDNLNLLAECTGLIDGYTDAQGLLTARIALADEYSTITHKLSCDDIYLTYGGGMALWAVMNLLGQEGDNFLFPSPGYPVSLGMANMIGMQPRFYNLEQSRNWQANIEQMQKLIDEKTKFILVIDPSNPLGSVWSAEHKRKIVELCMRKNIALLADEIYESMSYEVQVTPFAQLVQPYQIQKITIFKCSGLTKMYLGPGWRMGWLITYTSENNKPLINKCLRGMLNVWGMPTTIVQKAIPGIIFNLNNVIKVKDCIGRMHHNQKILKKELRNEHYCSFGHSSGAIFATIIIHLEQFEPEQIGEGIIDFTRYFYAEQNVIVYPGDLFTGKVPFIRMMISCSVQKIQEFLLRFKRFCRRHLKKQLWINLV